MTDDPQASVIAGYSAAADDLVPRFEALLSADILAPVAAYLPTSPARILDLGAGTGRDAAWFADQGHQVVAVEPASALRQAGMAVHLSPRIEWRSDALPEIDVPDQAFDFVLLSGVWQHLNPEQRAMSLARIAQAMAPKARCVLSLRQGPGAKERAVIPTDPQETTRQAARVGLSVIARIAAPSIQPANRAAGVSWIWLVLARA